MAKINLRDYYPYYQNDRFIDIQNDVAQALQKFERQEAAYKRKLYRHKAFYSLDRADGIECDILFVSLSPCEIYERKVTHEQLHTAVSILPDKQAKRIYAHYILGLSMVAIAKAEGVGKAAVSESIKRGLKSIEKILKNNF